LQKQLQKIEITGVGINIANEEKLIEPVAIHQHESKIIILRKKINSKLFWEVTEFSNSNIHRTLLFGAQFLSVSGQDLRMGSKVLPARILLSGQNKFDIIGLVRLREYLIGVVSSEMPLTWPLEALKAQAIASRSYANAIMNERKKNIFQLESSILDQVYSPVANLQWRPVSLLNVIRAVDETRGVLLLKNQKILKAFYHADCGGQTTSSASVFGTKELQGGVVDGTCPSNPKARWEYKISRKSLGQKVADFFHSSERLIPLKNFFALESTQNTRVQSVVFSYVNGLDRKVNSNQLRDILGFQDLKSTQFQISFRDSDEVVFKGVGYGHGVGLCQWGTKSLASQGKLHTQILLHYYPEAQLNVLSLKSAENLNSEKSDGDYNHNVF
jgi:stage II sporulation protein D